jgi:hypothetical protein
MTAAPHKNYKVGQVLYVLSHKETKIYPIQVVEEIIKRTVSGESISYLAKVGKSEKQIHLTEVEGDLFEDIEKLREVLTNRVIATINKVVEHAVLRANECYEQPEVHSPILDKEDLEQEKVLVQLPDGKIANLKL